MDLKEFKITKNRQRPEMCYAYEMYTLNKDKKYSIFTMNGGQSYLASITSKNLRGKLVDTDFSKAVDTVDEALKEFEIFENS